MKRLIILLSLSISCLSANAQSALVAAGPAPSDAPEVATTVNTAKPAAQPVFVDKENQLSYATMTVKGDMAVFTHLDGLNSVKAHVTDANGRELYASRVSTKKNALDISRLKSGLYFVTLVNEFNDRTKAFVLNR